jgi:hypothetical protein
MSPSDSLCADCGVDIYEIHEYYMVHDCVWHKGAAKKRGMMLCVGCLEKRLDRKLTNRVFTDMPVNDARFHYQSRRLWDRVNGWRVRLANVSCGRRAIGS